MPVIRTTGSESGETGDCYAPISRDGSLDGVDDSTLLLTHSTFMPPANFDAPEPSRKQRTRHSRKQPEGHIPRPPNAFILFRSSFIRSQRVSSEVETSHSTLSKIIGLTWQNLPEDERRVWHTKARAAGEEHRRKFPAYTFRPLHRRPPPSGADKDANAKRKVREHGLDDPARCEKIAELLVEGKHGEELHAAVQEFDKHRVSSVVARFETPLTATTYRRSSSAPAPDTEPPTAFLCSAPTNVPQRRRSSSSEPPCRSSVESIPPFPADHNCALETGAPSNFVSPWTLDPEPAYFDFAGFSFSPAGPPSPSTACDPLWLLPNALEQPPSSNFKFGVETQHGYPGDTNTNIGAFNIAQDWNYTMQDGQCGYDAPSYFAPFGYAAAQYQPYIAQPRPRQIDVDLSQLMAEYSLDA
ncbi:hypothetical protein B0H17DRAFT_1212361 [Mycena rosella]|uniref:HMG box domain-containing protein n=1 Tax=Mycena rosella TaxID=1033263 RepID=A0AAD7CRX6_MYCRO|nr:hypothetical protein B0H17DRAFT_1212361 [Mycena rosella]